MITTTGSITFEHNGVHAKMHLPTAASLAALKSFAETLADYTEASIVEVSFTQSEILEHMVGGGDSVLSTKATLLFHGETRMTPSKNFAIPAPKEDLFETTQGIGLTVKRAKGIAIANAYSALTGEQFKFIRGRLSS